MKLTEGNLQVDDLDEFLARLDAIGVEHGVAVQAFDARYVAGRDHIRRACELADRAFERDDTIARDPAVELLLYAAGRRQIEDALQMGVSHGEQPAVVVCHAVGDRQSGTTDDDALEREQAARDVVETMDNFDPGTTGGAPDPKLIADFFEITETERAVTDATLQALVLERVALLVVEK
ncbi:MAG: KEOPS complex subunit Cgi121 [Halorhabdus sp.]